jgi:hypothetical protein
MKVLILRMKTGGGVGLGMAPMDQTWTKYL